MTARRMSQNNMVWPSGHQCHDVIELGDMLLTLELRGRRMTYDTVVCSRLCCDGLKEHHVMFGFCSPMILHQERLNSCLRVQEYFPPSCLPSVF
ncbi:hypothetical protein JOB18_037599 [Solea senegalensis]|uniref:Uncharacterized protein n=1 Tax=Solea senegalensis TaxID=28829 RepID=A0AAV6PXZ7_SOLSE|nr:hypothetical protein JOB18_037599 [Solea senegalensis]KAG7479878.1 hypothetical protein JOB18_037599 [Solea senegalensis]KAG7479879.1 hypothetical protein JOB18_037599 [Solea senegalensis]